MIVNQWCKLSVQEVRKRTSKKIQKQQKKGNNNKKAEINEIEYTHVVEYIHIAKNYFLKLIELKNPNKIRKQKKNTKYQYQEWDSINNFMPNIWIFNEWTNSLKNTVYQNIIKKK